MIVRPYEDSDFGSLRYLHQTQNSKTLLYLSKETLPKIGFIANQEHSVAIGFLRLVEGGFAQIDTLVSNAHLSSDIRHLGISMVIDKLIESAKDLKLKGIIATSLDKGIIKRAEDIGFRVIPQTLIVLAL